MNNFAYITLLSSDDYIYYVIGLYESLLNVKAKYPLVCCTTSNLANDTIDILANIGINTYKLNGDKLFDSIISQNNKLGIRQNWNKALDKLKIFTVTKFDKCVFLDADVWVKHNIDDLFEKPCFTAVEELAPTLHPEHYDYKPGVSLFFSNLFVFKPSLDYYDSLIKSLPLLPKNVIWHDQAIFAYHNQDWMAHTELHLPCEYLIDQTPRCYRNFIKSGGRPEDIKVKHFGRHKKIPFNEVEYINHWTFKSCLEYFSYLDSLLIKYDKAINGKLERLKLYNIKKEPKVIK